MSKLTEKQKRFVTAYNGNIKDAAKSSGLSYDYCRQIVTKPHIKFALENRSSSVEKRKIATREQRQEFWTKTMREEEEPMRDRLRASELLGKSESDFTDKILVGEDKENEFKKEFDLDMQKVLNDLLEQADGN